MKASVLFHSNLTIGVISGEVGNMLSSLGCLGEFVDRLHQRCAIRSFITFVDQSK